MSQSIGLLEVNSLLAAVEAIDAMVKSAAVVIVGHRTIGDMTLVWVTGCKLM